MPQNPLDGSNYPPPARRIAASAAPPSAYMRSRTPANSNAGDGGISHTFLLWVFQQWWTVVIPVGLFLALAAGVAVVYFHVPQYEATALLIIEDSSPYVAFAAHDTGVDSKRYVQTQLELLRSPVVLEPVLGRVEIASMGELLAEQDRVAYLRDHLSIRQVGESELYNVAYKSAAANSAEKIVNAIVAEYLNMHSGDEFQRSQRVIDILEEERRRRGVEVERLRKHVVDLAKEVTGKDPFGGTEVTDLSRVLSPVGALSQSLTEADVELQVRRAELQALIDGPALVASSGEISNLIDFEVENQDEIRARQQGIRELEARMEQIKHEAVRYQKNPQWESDPAYVALKDEWNQRKKDLAESKEKLQQVILAQRKQKLEGERSQDIARLKRELAAIEARRDLLAKRFREQVGEVQSGGAKSVELEFARAELDREERVFELIASRKLALQTELRAPARVQLRRKATVPSAPIEPVPYKLLFLVCSAVFVAPFGLALLRELTVRRISDIEQLAHESRLRVLGEVAALPVRYVAVSPNQLAGRLRRETYVFAESINSLRTNLELAEGGSGHQVLVVTSAAPSEGKTSVAVSLAMSISNATEKPILIIDGDMRSPSVATMLKAKNQPGLFDILSNRCKLDDAIQQVGQGNLYLIPAGRATKSTHTVVGINELKHLLDQLRGRFSTIIIDTPPILGASESLVLAKAADSVLFCSLCDVSKAKQIRIAIDRLEHAGVNVAGAVLSGMPARRYEYVYGYYANRLESSE